MESDYYILIFLNVVVIGIDIYADRGRKGYFFSSRLIENLHLIHIRFPLVSMFLFQDD